MYKLIRRISSSFFPRADRPWNDDATSNAPQIGHKRRLSDSDDDDLPSPSLSKKLRREDTEIIIDGHDFAQSSSQAGKEGEGVKEVTKGVRDVDLEDNTHGELETIEEAADVPLPESPALTAQADPAAEKVTAEESTKTGAEEGKDVLESAEKTEEAQSSASDAQEDDAAEEGNETATVVSQDGSEPSTVANDDTQAEGEQVVSKHDDTTAVQEIQAVSMEPVRAENVVATA